MKEQAKPPNKILRLFTAFPKQVDRFFNWYGALIADHAIWFIAIPLLVTFVLAPGILQLEKLTDDMKMWPMSGSFSINSISGKAQFKSLPSVCTCVRCDENNENCNRTNDCGDDIPKQCKGASDGIDITCPHLQLMFVSRNKSMTDPEMVQELLEIDLQLTFAKYTIQKFKPAFFSSNNSEWRICQVQPDGSCTQYSVLTVVLAQLAKLPGLQDYSSQVKFLMELQDDPEKQESFKAMLKGQIDKPTYYPFDSNQPNAMFIGPIYGGVTLEKESESWKTGVKAGKVKHIKGMQMLYCLNDSEAMVDTNTNWTREMTKWLEHRYTNNKSFKAFELTVAHSWSRFDRNGEEILRMVPQLIVCIISLMIFVGLATVLGYPAHRSLPWIGVIGVGTSVLGIGSSFGLVGWMRMQVVDLCFAIPVLILAVGIDDVFVYTEGWRASKPEWLIRRRLAKTMRTACPGIVVTSFMNSLAFIIDTQTPFNMLQIFSNVAVVAATFDFVFQMTLFPACYAYLARAEKKNRHACFCCVTVKARTNKNYRNDGFCYLICCTAPASTILKEEGLKEEENEKKRQKEEKENKSKEKEILAIEMATVDQPNKSALAALPSPPPVKKIMDDANEEESKTKESEKSKHFWRDIYTPFLLKPAVSARLSISS